MTDEATTGERTESRIRIDRIYLKDVSFESPQTPAIFSTEEGWQPKMDLHMETEARRIDDERHEVALRVTVTATDGDRTVFLAEIKQAGLFHLAGFDDEQRKYALGTSCANMLFPFARENLDHLVQKGGMPQLLLQPINFEALHAQQAAKRANPESRNTDGSGGSATDSG